jgi:Bacterial dnaA protein helix-turn-helix/GcrA cell cycle regulator
MSRPGGRSLEELDGTTCRFPIGEPGELGFHFCGEAPIARYPYCARHTRIAYQPDSTLEQPVPAMHGYTCRPHGDGAGRIYFSPLALRDRARRRPAVDAGVSSAAEIFARHARARTRLTRPAVLASPLPGAPPCSPPKPVITFQMLPKLARLRGQDQAPPAIAPTGRRPLTIRSIMQAVAAFYRISVLDIASRSRTGNIVRPRHVACFLCRKLTAMSLSEIGRRVGGTDHAAVLHAVRKIERRIGEDADLAAQVAAIRARLGRGGERGAQGRALCRPTLEHKANIGMEEEQPSWGDREGGGRRNRACAIRAASSRRSRPTRC